MFHLWRRFTTLALLLLVALLLSTRPAASSDPKQPIPKANPAPTILLPEPTAPAVGMADVLSPAGNVSVCMTVGNTDVTSLPIITTRICRQTPDQVWEPDANGYWHSGLDPTYCLASAGSISSSQRLTVRPCTDSRALRLQREGTSNIFIVQGTTLTLDLATSTNQVAIWPRHGGVNQQWRWLGDDLAIAEANKNILISYPLALSDSAAQQLEVARDRIAKLQPPFIVPDSAWRDASVYPGAVPKGSPLVSQTFAFDLRYRDPALTRMNTPSRNWLTTGLYAPPGEIVTITVSGATLEELQNVYVQLGVHTDALLPTSGNVTSSGKFLRYAQIAMRVPLLPGENQVRNPYGGAIVLGSDRSVDKTVVIEVADAVQAPHLIVGQTTEAEWLALRAAPAPWAALESDSAVVHLPSERVRTMSYSDAVTVADWHSLVAETHNTLSGFSEDGPEPHYPPQGQYPFVVDRQITAGSAHAGFPMMFFDWYDLHNPTNARRNTDTDWGLFHELGHDYQMSALWTSAFGSEVTVNLWSLHAQERLFGISRPAQEGRYASAIALLNDSTKPNKWASADLWQQLVFLDQIRLGFPALDWDLWTQLIRRYREMSPDEVSRLNTDQARRDRFMTLLCEITTTDLTPHFEKWTIAVTQAAKDTCNSYPDLTQEIWLIDAAKPLNPGTGTGQLLHERWTNLPGSTVASLTSSPRYPNSPTSSAFLTGQLETPSNSADSYGERLRGYLHPPVTGDYYFWIASNDDSRVLLSSDDTPANAQTLLSFSGSVGVRQFDARLIAEQRSAPIPLVAGQRYYFEVLHKESSGSDNLAIAWTVPSGPEGVSEPRKIIDGRFFSPYVPTSLGVESLANSDGLLAAFPFDESAGATSFADGSGLGKTATCTGSGCPTAGVAGRLGHAARFDGASDLLTAPVTLPDGPFTLAAWINSSAGSWNQWRTLMTFGDDAPWFGVTNEGHLALYPDLYGGKVPLGEWVHVVYSYGGSADPLSRLYVNGQLVQESASAEPATGGTTLFLGGEGGGANRWRGLLDDVRVYNRALDAEEVDSLAHPGEAVPPTPNSDPNTPLVSGSLTAGGLAAGTPAQVRYIDLTVSIYRPLLTPADRAPYEAILGHFADAIYEMTNGAHRVRTITIYDDGRMADQANVIWAIEEWPRARLAGYGQPAQQIVMGDTFAFDTPYDPLAPANQRGAGYTLAQQWGFYFYGLVGEYAMEAGDTPPQGGSVMTSPWAAATSDTYSALNFSSIASTSGVGQTASEQFRTYAASGWETLSRPPQDDPQESRNIRPYWPDLIQVAPDATSLPTIELPAEQAIARAELAIVWERDALARGAALTSKQRVFLLDNSGAMGEANRLSSLKKAITSYVDGANDDDQIALLTFGDQTSLLLPLTTLGDAEQRATLKGVIDSIVLGLEGHDAEAMEGWGALQASEIASNDRFVLGADRLALDILQGTASEDRAIYLFTTGGFTDAVPDVYAALCQDHAAEGVPLSIYNFSEASRENDAFTNSVELLQRLASCAGGSYQYVGGGDFTVGMALIGEETRLTELLNGLKDSDQATTPTLDVSLGTERNVVATPLEPFETQIFVDPSLDEFELFIAYEGGINDTNFYLNPPSGKLPPGTVAYCDTDGRMNLCTIPISDPENGVWELEVEALVGEVPIEFRGTGFTLTGLTYQAMLRSLSGTAISFPNEILLEASVYLVDPIADAGIRAWVETPSGDYEDVEFYDDGIAPDDIADDGLYHALLDYQQDGDYRVTLVFDNIDGEAYYSPDSFLRGPDPSGNLTDIPYYLVENDFDRFATLELFVSGYGDDDHGNEQSTATDIAATNEPVASHVDYAGDADTFRVQAPLPTEGDPKSENGPVTSAEASYVVRFESFSEGMEATLVVWQHGEVHEYYLPPLNYDEYYYLPLRIRAGEEVYVQVSHADEEAIQGRYKVSFGEPLPGEEVEEADNTIYLPLVTRD